MSRLLTAAGRWIDRIKINDLAREPRGDRMYWVKRRRPAAGTIIALANAFFRLAGNPVVILPNDSTWQTWERTCLELLHGDEAAVHSDARGWWVSEFPGESVASHLARGAATSEMFSAAARELRRAHGLDCVDLRGAWSHGDPHSGNFIYDGATDRACLMDFEVRHDGALPPDARHADDLLVFLQDTLGRLPRAEWLEMAGVFVRTYDRPEITARLIERLAEPRGLARLWWAVRTTYLAPRELSLRLAALRAALT
jgi:hypothetical protein